MASAISVAVPNDRSRVRVRGSSARGGYRRIVVAVVPGLDTARAVKTALELAADRARVTAVGVIEVPADLPLDAEMPAEEAKVHALLAAATLQADARGLPLAARPLRAREAGKAIVDESSRQQADLTVLGPAEGRAPTRRKGWEGLGPTAGYVLRNATCPVVVMRRPAAVRT